MAQIQKFDPRVMQGVRKFLNEERPVVKLEQLREINLEGPGSEMVRVESLACDKCGFTCSPDASPMFGDKVWPWDTFEAVRLTHAYDQSSRSKYCGGTFEVRTRPHLGLVAV